MPNDFSGDRYCEALYRFENGALTTDSKGTNTLTNTGTVVNNTSDYQEGTASAYFDKSIEQYFTITDADLDPSFPLKNGNIGIFSITFWFNVDSHDTLVQLFSKRDFTTFDESFRVMDNNGTLTASIGTDAAEFEEQLGNSYSTSTGRWYHLGVTFDNTTKAWKLRIWDDTAGSVVHNESGTTTKNMSINNVPLNIGGAYSGFGAYIVDGLMDEVVIFRDILTTDEIDAIRQGTYAEVTPVRTFNIS